MKNTFYLALWMCFFTELAAGQHMRENVMSLSKKYSPLWGSSRAVMTMSLWKDWELGATDSVYSFTVSVTETETEVQSVSVGFSSFSVGGLLGLGGGSSATANINKQNGLVVLSRDVFLDFYKCVNDVYRATGSLSARNQPKNTLSTCEVGGIKFGGEYLPKQANGYDQKFYFQLGEAVFSMSKTDFEEIVRFVRDSKQVYEKH